MIRPRYRNWNEHEAHCRRDHANELLNPWGLLGHYKAIMDNRTPVAMAMKRALVPRYAALLPKKGKILVMGAGMGDERKLLSEVASDDRITYSDLSQEALGYIPGASRKIAASSYTLEPFQNGEFDAVVSMDHLDVFPPEFMPLVLNSAHRVLAPNGLMLSAHTSIPSLDIWGANPSRSIDVIGRVIDRTAADETELNDIRTRYRYALKGGMGKPIGGRPPLFRDVTHEMVAGTHFGGWEPRHALFDVGHQHRVPRGDIPTYLHVFGNIGMGGLNEGMGELRSMKSNLGREGKYLVMPDIEDLRRRYQRPVGEIFVHDMIYGHKAGD